MNKVMKVAGAIALGVVLSGVVALATPPAETDHNVIVELESVYAIWVYRPGHASNTVHILADPLAPVSDDSARLGYFLNQVGENGTRVTVISSWTNYHPEWFKCYLKPQWGIAQPRGHVLQFTKQWLAGIWTMPAVMILIEKDAALGTIDALILEYEVEVTIPNTPAGTQSVGTITYRIEDVP